MQSCGVNDASQCLILRDLRIRRFSSVNILFKIGTYSDLIVSKAHGETIKSTDASIRLTNAPPRKDWRIVTSDWDGTY